MEMAIYLLLVNRQIEKQYLNFSMRVILLNYIIYFIIHSVSDVEIKIRLSETKLPVLQTEK